MGPRITWVRGVGVGCLLGIAAGWVLGQARPVSPYIVPLTQARFFQSVDRKATVGLWLGPVLSQPGVRLHLGTLSFEPGAEVPPHTHSHAHELLFVLEGGGTLRVGDRHYVLKAPVAVFIPAGLEHSFVNDQDRPLRALQVYDPAGPERRFLQWHPIAPLWPRSEDF